MGLAGFWQKDRWEAKKHDRKHFARLSKTRFGGIDIDYQIGLAAERAGLYATAETDSDAARVASIDQFMMSLPSLGPPEAEEFCLDRINTADYDQVHGAIEEFYQAQGFEYTGREWEYMMFRKDKTRLSVLTTFQPSIIVTVQDWSHYGEPYNE